MYDLMVTILTSSAISSLIAVISNIFLNQKKNSLEYITSERKAWRKEIREIAEEIEKADENDINIPLTKLKVRINAFDYFGQNQQDSGDYALWLSIGMLEKVSSGMHKFVKKYLIMLISLMLKYDWERSKKEVKINKADGLMHLCTIIQIIIYLLLNRIFNFEFINGVTFALVYIVFLLVINIIIGAETLDRKKKFMFCGFFFGIVYGGTLRVFCDIDLIMGGEVITSILQKISWGSVAILPTGFWFFFSIKKNTLEKYRYDYMISLKKITEEMRMKMDSIHSE